MLKSIICALIACMLIACQAQVESENPKGVLRIATVPADMPIIVNGQPKGNSPSGEGQYFSISLEEGEHTIEILKSTDEQKDQYAKKVVFIAADTIPVVTLEAKERLTPFGLQEKVKRETEALEKSRLAEIERNKEIEVRKKKNKEHENLLNNVSINIFDSNISNKNSISFKIKDCDILVKNKYGKGYRTITVDGKNLSKEPSFFTDYPDGKYARSWSSSAKCKNGEDCVSFKYYGIENNDFKSNSITFATFRSDDKSDSGVEEIKKISAALRSIVGNCQ